MLPSLTRHSRLTEFSRVRASDASSVAAGPSAGEFRKSGMSGQHQERSSGDDVVPSVAIWAMTIFSFCPIAMFVSQKIWIDNCLMFSVTASSLIHAYICNTKLNSSSTVADSAAWMALSGLAFGVLAMQTKITALASLPFVFLTIARTLHSDDSNDQQDIMPRSKEGRSFVILSSCASFLVGVTVGFGPWVVLYQVSNGTYTDYVFTHRLLNMLTYFVCRYERACGFRPPGRPRQ